MKNGVFISYRHSYAFFAGRIHDYLQNMGLAPFIDVYRMRQDNFTDVIVQNIKECTFFLLVLGKNSLDNLAEDNVFLLEIKTALECKSTEEILIVAERDFVFPSLDRLPKEIHNLTRHHYDTITHDRFLSDMNRVMDNLYSNVEKFNEAINWREYVVTNGTTLVGSRSIIEGRYATLENRFGKELINAVKNGEHYNGQQIIKKIRMSCYAASIIFNPARDMVDDKAFDNGLIFNTFGELLRDPEFSLEIIINAPGSVGAIEAEKHNMLGNSALEDYPNAVFLGAYAGLYRLIKEVPEYIKAYKERRFRYYLSDSVMSGAFFQIEYKDNWSEFDHIKYDIYSYALATNMERRSMLFFKVNDTENYEYMQKTFDYLKNNRMKPVEIQANHEKWMQEWNAFQEEY